MNDEATSRLFLNQTARDRTSRPLTAWNRVPLQFHQRLPGYAPTPLVNSPDIAQMLGIGEVLLKNEGCRLGMPAFKILGASWAIYRTLEERIGTTIKRWETLEGLKQHLRPLGPITLATATDGNHGRAVAHMAALLGFPARIYVPRGTANARVDAITREGATVELIDGTYDDAVIRAARDESDRCLVISDTSWPGYEDVPRWVMDGYSTILWEVDDELARLGGKDPDLIAVQFGVGALAAAVVNHYRQPTRETHPTILSVEPLRAACMLASMEAGEVVSVPGPHDSIMAGLNCGRPSIVAWPIVSSGVDAFIAIPDELARQAMRALARSGIVAGETGAAGLAGLIELLIGPNNVQNRANLQVSENTRALLFITEGATDPRSYEQITGFV